MRCTPMKKSMHAGHNPALLSLSHRILTCGFVSLWIGLSLAIGPSAYGDVRALHPTPRIGILVPIGPPDYAPLWRHIKVSGQEHYGPFHFTSGSLHGIPVVICIQPFGGEFTRSLTAQSLLTHFDVRAILYPGTSGAHLPPSQMTIGDLVLGAKQVNFGNFFMGRSGRIVPDEFQGVSSMGSLDVLYLNPVLLSDLAKTATQVAKTYTLPLWLNPQAPRRRPRIFYFGTQGTSSMWLANEAFIEKTDQVFHEIDEDGDWFSGVVAALYHCPFIEVSTISDSIFEFPKTARGIPPEPARSKDRQAQATAGDVAQTLSDDVAVAFIERYGHRLLTHHYRTPHHSPFPSAWYQDPTDPRTLLRKP